jgi:hypothetical protein
MCNPVYPFRTKYIIGYCDAMCGVRFHGCGCAYILGHFVAVCRCRVHSGREVSL